MASTCLPRFEAGQFFAFGMEFSTASDEPILRCGERSLQPAEGVAIEFNRLPGQFGRGKRRKALQNGGESIQQSLKFAGALGTGEDLGGLIER
ncbi:MAG TPA: hypothetical protein VEG32_00080 [Clostridia bacterium]|nr:hypothetical protein [Clostridia bacterium]